MVERAVDVGEAVGSIPTGPTMTLEQSKRELLSDKQVDAITQIGLDYSARVFEVGGMKVDKIIKSLVEQGFLLLKVEDSKYGLTFGRIELKDSAGKLLWYNDFDAAMDSIGKPRRKAGDIQ